jgi:hypothetical protein
MLFTAVIKEVNKAKKETGTQWGEGRDLLSCAGPS